MTQQDLDKLSEEMSFDWLEPELAANEIYSAGIQEGFKKALELVNEQFKNAEYTIDAKVWLVETIYNLTL